MQVYKFGGTSVGAPQRMQQVAQLIQDGPTKIVVLSAVAGTTNKLVELDRLLRADRLLEAGELLADLAEEYEQFIQELFKTREALRQGRQVLRQHFGSLNQWAQESYRPETEKLILAQGELISTRLFQCYLESRNISSTLLPALDFMVTDENGEPDLKAIRSGINRQLAAHPGQSLFITQGYICRNAKGEVDNLQRGGSDYTATLIGAAIRAEEIQIWTDIDGLHNNDPRIVPNTYPVRQVSYREAAELAYFGAKILHPACVLPAEQLRVPIRLKNTFEPHAEGTLISARSSGTTITAIAAKDGITAIKIRSHRMLMAYGFLRRVFEVFEKYRTPIDMITTSEVAVSLTIDHLEHLEDILGELTAFGEVNCDADQTIICIVGDNLHDQHGYAQHIFAALSEVPVRMVSYGGSNNNISILIHTEYKAKALRALNRTLFAEPVAVRVGKV